MTFMVVLLGEGGACWHCHPYRLPQVGTDRNRLHAPLVDALVLFFFFFPLSFAFPSFQVLTATGTPSCTFSSVTVRVHTYSRYSKVVLYVSEAFVSNQSGRGALVCGACRLETHGEA